MKTKATSFDIAHLAGVSQSTVSRALRNSPLVNQKTKDKVFEIARTLNYKVDKSASNLRRRHSQTIALLLFEDPTTDDSMVNPFFLTMLGSITKTCAEAGYDLLVSFQQLSTDWRADFEDTNKADGIILLGYGDFAEHQPILKALWESNTHFICWGLLDNDYGVSVSSNNFKGGHDVTRHLIQQGREQLCFVGEANRHFPEYLDRFLGFKKALEHADLGGKSPMQIAATEEASAYTAVRALLASGQVLDALVCASDLIAIGAMRALGEAGAMIPEDVAIVGYDDIPASKYAVVPLTTVRQNTRLAGELLVNNLIRLIKGEKVQTHMMDAELVIRQSCGQHLLKSPC